ncbi:hypothetical protein QR680_001896 [Steinernema hermaphroditum]|uniref:SCP domain-containing protein n=1 Tax=Steinernema hermaphroditum TaxID=289476 RepID=A0AA39H0B7_9BILA|nr:hypothetical protein QR680_001896 [Steinernema hermaphroditum]
MDSTFVENFISAHNTYRRQHGAPDLQLDGELCELAQQWAEKLARKRHLSYCEIPGIGENITFFPLDIPPEKAVQHWYGEHEKYEYETPGWQAGTNYFTQIVWKATKEIGVGSARVPDDDMENDANENCTKRVRKSKRDDSSLKNHQVIVAFYRPAGNNNRSGQFLANVTKPKEL